MGLWASGPWSSFFGSRATLAPESPAGHLPSASTWVKTAAKSSKASLGRNRRGTKRPGLGPCTGDVPDHIPEDRTREGGHPGQIGEWESLGILVWGVGPRSQLPWASVVERMGAGLSVLHHA